MNRNEKINMLLSGKNLADFKSKALEFHWDNKNATKDPEQNYHCYTCKIDGIIVSHDEFIAQSKKQHDPLNPEAHFSLFVDGVER